MKIDPFLNSESLTRWVAQILTDRQLGELKNWRMLEYWMQVEIYHAVEKGQAGNWRHLGYYEQPYYTSTPLSGSKTNIKWVDLVFVSPNLEKPKRIIWIELKDLGRSTDRIISNAKVLGHDLAALYHLNTVETKRVWMTPHLMW